MEGLEPLVAFLQARTWLESRRVVEEHPQLLSDEADALLGQLIAAEENADVRRYLEEHRALLRRCREVGVERAFREKTAPSLDELLEALQKHPELGTLLEQIQQRIAQDPLMQSIQALMEAGSPASLLRVARDHPVLFTPEAEARIHEGLRNARAFGQEEFAHAMEERYRALKELRDWAYRSGLTLEQAIAAAQAAEEMMARLPPQAREALAGLLDEGISSPQELEARLRERPDLMEALAHSLSAAPSEEEMRYHPLYRLAERVMRGELSLEAALQQATAPDTLKVLDDRAIDRLDDYILALSCDPACPTQARVRAYILAELNHAAAQALPASPPIRAYTANTLGNCIDDYPFKTPAHLERRVEAYREALTIWQQEGDERWVAMLQHNLGNAYSDLAAVRDREGNLERAIAAYREALRFRTPEAAPLEYATTQNNLGTAYSDLAAVRDREGNLERAIAAYREALGMIDRFFLTASVAAQLGLQEEWAGLYTRAVEACHRAGQPALAFAIAEGSKSRLLTGLLGRGDLPAPAILPAELVAQERTLTERLNALDAAALARHGRATTAEEGVARLDHLQQRQALVEQLLALWQTMETYGPQASDYVALRRGDRPSWEGLVRLAEALGPQTALLSLFTTGERILLFVLRAGWERPQSVEVSLTPDELNYVYRANYQDEVLNRRRHLQAGRPLTHRWRGLGRPLLSPVLPYLEGVTHLVIAPQSLFHLLPLHALELNGDGETLLDRYALSYIPALGLLERLWRREPIAQGEAVVVGYTPADPTTEQGQGERQLFLGEARAVANQMGVEPLLDQEASAERLREVLTKRTLRLVHLSCHGSFDPQDPLRSGVLLADGLFTARQWMELRLRADLVTLSACQTGLAGRLAGDELAGLSQALLYAGASSLLVGLWSVNAWTTASLMEDFYRRLWDESGHKKTDEASALRQAALALRNGELLPPTEHLDPSDPYYWAPFILIGDWR